MPNEINAVGLVSTFCVAQSEYNHVFVVKSPVRIAEPVTPGLPIVRLKMPGDTLLTLLIAVFPAVRLPVNVPSEKSLVTGVVQASSVVVIQPYTPLPMLW